MKRCLKIRIFKLKESQFIFCIITIIVILLFYYFFTNDGFVEVQKGC